MRAKVSLLGMMQFDPTIMDNFRVPEVLNRESIIDQILAESMDLEIMYSNPAFLKSIIGTWCNLNINVWKHLWETTQYEYNPINNYDRTETRTWKEDRTRQDDIGKQRTDNGDGQSTKSYSDKDDKNWRDSGESNSSTNASTDDTTTQNTTTETEKAAYNSSTYEPVDRTTQDISQTHTNTATGRVNNDESHSGSENITKAGSETGSQTYLNTSRESENRSEDENTQHEETITAKGNIGVTSTQQMIQQEREIAKFNLANYIVSEFITRFCLLVY